MLFRAPLSAVPFGRLSQEMDRLVESMISATPSAQPGSATLPLNIWESEGMLHLESELPGVKRENLELTFESGSLTIRAERTSTTPEGATMIRRERGWGVAQRVVSIPSEFDADRIDASLQNGVLHITMPKVESAQPRRIEVRGTTGNELS